jgi:hypothetical protein
MSGSDDAVLARGEERAAMPSREVAIDARQAPGGGPRIAFQPGQRLTITARRGEVIVLGAEARDLEFRRDGDALVIVHANGGEIRLPGIVASPDGVVIATLDAVLPALEAIALAVGATQTASGEGEAPTPVVSIQVEPGSREFARPGAEAAAMRILAQASAPMKASAPPSDGLGASMQVGGDPDMRAGAPAAQSLPNRGPVAIVLSSTSVGENLLGAAIGAIGVSDPDAGDRHEVSVDDPRFEVASGVLSLRPGIRLDHEVEPTVVVMVTATDEAGASRSQAVTITVVDVDPESVSGGAGRDVLHGGRGDDWFSGGAGDDTLSGGAGNDTLVGGTGDDVLDGGDGDDSFLLEPGDDGIDRHEGGAGIDAILGTAGVADTLRVADGLANISGIEVLDGGAGATNTILAGGGGDRAGSARTASPMPRTRSASPT